MLLAKDPVQLSHPRLNVPGKDTEKYLNASLEAGLEFAYSNHEIEVESPRQQAEYLVQPWQLDRVGILPDLASERAQLITSAPLCRMPFGVYSIIIGN